MSDMQRFWTVLAVLAVLTTVIGIALARHAQVRTAELRRRFGPEYDRAVEELGNTARAERELEQRARRLEHFRLSDLNPVDRERFAAYWNRVQDYFATDPVVAVTATTELINQVMRARGYSTICYEQRVADLSVAHPLVVQHYRAAHELSRSVNNGVADTELLRQALVHYRMLFTELLQDSRGVSAPPAPLRHLPPPRAA